MIILNSFSSDHGLNHPHLKLQKYVFLEKSHNLELLCIDKLETLSLFYDWQVQSMQQCPAVPTCCRWLIVTAVDAAEGKSSVRKRHPLLSYFQSFKQWHSYTILSLSLNQSNHGLRFQETKNSLGGNFTNSYRRITEKRILSIWCANTHLPPLYDKNKLNMFAMLAIFGTS